MLLFISRPLIISYSFFAGAIALEWFQIKPTNSLDKQHLQDGWTPKPTEPPALAHQALKRDANVCGIMQDNSVYSDYTYTCQASDSCLYESGWWGCCYTTPVPGCYEIVCPWVTSCVDYQQLTSCGSSCSSNAAVLKCTDSRRPFCATATGVESVDNEYMTTSPEVLWTSFNHIECAASQYSISFTVTALQLMEIPCAEQWATNPSSLSKSPTTVSTSVAILPSLFDGIVVRGQVAPNTTTITDTLTPSAPTATVTIQETVTVTSGGNTYWRRWSLNGMLGTLLIALWLLK
jgi:hypothetical protein